MRNRIRAFFPAELGDGSVRCNYKKKFFYVQPVYYFSSVVDRAGRFEVGVGSIPGGRRGFFLFFLFLPLVIFDAERIFELKIISAYT